MSDDGTNELGRRLVAACVSYLVGHVGVDRMLMILRDQLIQRHRKQRPLTPTFSPNESHEKCPRSREGIFSFVYRPAQCFVTV